VDPQNIPLNDYELTIVLGNLFENAYSASSTVICPHINLTISNTAEDVFTVNIENNFENVNKSSEKITAFDFIHGYGLANVKRIVSEHNGVFNTSSSNDIYSVTIILPLNLT
jgi:sensor histidine kinase YesM